MNKLRELRKSKGLSQQDLSKLLGVNQTAVSQWERNITNPTTNMLVKLSQVLGICIDDLIDYLYSNQYLLKIANPNENHRDLYEVITDYKNGVICVLNKTTNQRVVIPYRIKIEGDGSFISNLKMLRKTKRLTQEKLALECGFSYSTIVSYEKGLRQPTGRNLCILASYFGIDAESLLGTDINKE